LEKIVLPPRAVLQATLNEIGGFQQFKEVLEEEAKLRDVAENEILHCLVSIIWAALGGCPWK